MVKVTDYVVQFLLDRGITDIFLVSGGGIMHALDSVGRNQRMTYYCNYHEQACVVAAEGYARRTGRVGVALVTVGPGAANAVAGVPGAWVDSIPIMVLSGQVRQDLIADYSKLRQLGPQETNTLGMAKAVTKYAVRITEPKRIRYELEAAYHHALEGRPGPVWVELPLDVQGAQVDESALEPFVAPKTDSRSRVEAYVQQAICALRNSTRPLIVPGNGVRLSHSEGLLRDVVERLQIPVVFPFSSKDLIEEDHPLNTGVFGTAGQRRGNFAVQNSDCLLALGVGLNCQKVGFNYKGFAPKAKKIVVEVDRNQLFEQVVKPDVPILCDVRPFLEELLRQTESTLVGPFADWVNACRRWRARYPLMTPDFFQDTEHVNSYVFMDKLSSVARATDTIVTGAGLDVVSCYQAFRVKSNQRVLISGWGSMGWDLPLTIGACVGSGKTRVICVTGDGSIQWNIQELLTMQKYRLPVKLFVFNNKGFGSIRSTQNFFDGRFVGSDPNSGLADPIFKDLAGVYGFEYIWIQNHALLEDSLRRALSDDNPTFCEVNIAPSQTISPKASAVRRADGTFESRPLEDMAPFLPREEVYENMHLFDDETVRGR